MSTKAKVFIAIAIWLGGAIILALLVGSEGKNDAFKPQDEFRLEPWIDLKLAGIDVSFTKATMYLVIASALTIGFMTWIARKMQQHPNKVQMAVELAYDLTRNNITGSNLDTKMATRWFPFLATLFFFLWFSNMVGLIPLPTNTHEKIGIFGLDVPAFALYAATANISIPIVLALVVTAAYHLEGMRHHGPIKYFGTWLPPGLESMHPVGKGAIWVIEALSHLVRPISLSVRLFANILAGHLLILFMGGGLAVLLGLAALGFLTFPMAFAFFVFEIGLVATLQAFIFTILTAIYLGGATSESH